MYGVGGLLEKAARFFPTRLALADSKGHLDYGDLDTRVNQLANALADLGLAKGSRLGFVCPNCNEFSELWLATQKAGIVAVLLNYQVPPEEIIRDVRHARCDGVFLAPSWQATLAPTLSEEMPCLTFGGNVSEGAIDLDAAREGANEAPPPRTYR